MEQSGTVWHSRTGRLGLRPAGYDLCAFRALLRRIQFLAVPQNPFRRIEQICSSEIWLFPKRFAVVPIDKDGSTTHAFAAIDISPTISNHKRSGQINIERGCCVDEHPRPWLPTFALFTEFGASVVADLNPIDRQLSNHHFVNRFHDLLFEDATADIRLVCHHNQQKPSVLEVRACLIHAGQNLELSNGSWRIWLPFDNDRSIDHSVTIEKDSFVRHHLRENSNSRERPARIRYAKALRAGRKGYKDEDKLLIVFPAPP
jgi:hypothetical protein